MESKMEESIISKKKYGEGTVVSRKFVGRYSMGHLFCEVIPCSSSTTDRLANQPSNYQGELDSFLSAV
eukprot:scaffold14367_cov250-Ochromonas_danica.AAC.9